MPFTRPSLAELITRNTQEVALGLGKSPLLSRSVEAVLARVQALGAHGLYGHQEWLARQLFPDTAEAEQLVRWARIWGLDRKPAVGAFGNILCTGTVGVTVPEGAELKNSQGADFVVRDAVSLQVASAVVEVFSPSGGKVSNTAAGDKLTFVTPVAGIDPQASILEPGLINGAEAETDAELRARLLQRIRSGPKGGAASDYELWALEVAEVTRAWVYPLWMGAGTVGVTFVLDAQPTNILPGGPKIAEVQAYIEARAPIGAVPFIFAPVAKAVDLTIALEPNTSQLQAAVKASIEDLFRREAEPGASLALTKINEAISTTPGETGHAIVEPISNIETEPGELAVLGNLTWV